MSICGNLWIIRINANFVPLNIKRIDTNYPPGVVNFVKHIMASPLKFALALVLAALVYLVVMLIMGVAKRMEDFRPVYQGASWSSTSSSWPVSYDSRPSKYTNSTNIRRWRTPVPTGPGARQVQDDTWARAYDPGLGVQLGGA